MMRGDAEKLLMLPRLFSSLAASKSPIAKPPLIVDDDKDLGAHGVGRRNNPILSLVDRESLLLMANESSSPVAENGRENENENNFVNESAVWRRIERSLSLPAIYRRKEDLNLTFRMLSQVPFLKYLNNEERFVVANSMKIVSFPTSGCVAFDKAWYSGDNVDDDAGIIGECANEKGYAQNFSNRDNCASTVENSGETRNNIKNGLSGRFVASSESNDCSRKAEVHFQEAKKFPQRMSTALPPEKYGVSLSLKSKNVGGVKECREPNDIRSASEEGMVNQTSDSQHFIVQVMRASPDRRSSDLGTDINTKPDPSLANVHYPSVPQSADNRPQRCSAVSNTKECAAVKKSGAITSRSCVFPLLEKNSSSSPTALSPYLKTPMHRSPVFILARGKMLLEMPTTNGAQYYPILPLDSFGHELWLRNIPENAKCITTEPCTVVVLDLRDPELHFVLNRANESLLEEQKRYLRDTLKVKIFASWEEAEFEECAKCLLPLRTESFQIVVEEDEVSDALYFLKEGQLTVTRLVKPQLQKRKLKHLPSSVTVSSLYMPHSPTLLQGRAPRLFRHLQHTTLLPSEHVMQVASLQPGEFFGELGLLAHNPDVRPGENIIWTDRYWFDALSNRFQQSRNTVAAETFFLKDLCSKKPNAQNAPEKKSDDQGENVHNVGLADQSLAKSAGQPKLCRPMLGENEKNEKGLNERKKKEYTEKDGFVASSQSFLPEEEEPIDQRYPIQTAPRKATVYAQLPSVLYRLSYECCRRHIGGLALTRLLEFMKGYPSHEEVYEQFEKQLKWTVYRDEFIADILQQNQQTTRKESLPKLKMK